MAHCPSWIVTLLIASTAWALLGAHGNTAAAQSIAAGTAPHDALKTITDAELFDHVKFLADDAREGREAGKAGGKSAGDYLLEQIQELGLKPGGPNNQYVQSFRGEMRNILAILPGSDPELAKETVVIGAHYDHVGFGRRRMGTPNAKVYNGANDNASGTAGVLEIAEAMAQLPQTPRRSILFAFWDGEEKGLLGSRHFVQNPTVDLDRIVFAIALDMIGRIEDNHFVLWGTGTAVGLRKLVARNNAVSDLDLEFRVFNLVLSDHQPFFVKDIPVLLPSSGLFPELHRPTDDVERINADGMRRASQLICSLVYDLANRADRMEFAEVSKSEVSRSPSRTATPPTPHSSDPAFKFGFTCQRAPREPAAIIVVRVAADTPAAMAGLQTGDRIYRIGKTSVAELDLASSILADASKPVSLAVEHRGRLRTITLDPHAGTPRAPRPFEPRSVTHAWSKTQPKRPANGCERVRNVAASVLKSCVRRPHGL